MLLLLSFLLLLLLHDIFLNILHLCTSYLASRTMHLCACVRVPMRVPGLLQAPNKKVKNDGVNNSIFKVNITMKLISGDPCFKIPSSAGDGDGEHAEVGAAGGRSNGAMGGYGSGSVRSVVVVVRWMTHTDFQSLPCKQMVCTWLNPPWFSLADLD